MGAKTTEGKAIRSQNVIVGKRYRQKALEQAMKEFYSALTKIDALIGKRKEWRGI